MQNWRLYFAVILFPLSLIYGMIVFFRNLFFDLGILKSVSFQLPVISVGNLTAGGTGKTPHVEYLVSLLRSRYKIAVLSRGYKRKSKGFQMTVAGSTVEEIGDELLQIYNRFPDVIVAADKDRARGIGQLTKKFPELQAIILDDAFQHRYVSPGLSIVLVDHARPVFNDFLLPMGNLRENRRNINRADMVIVTKCPPEMNELQRHKFVSRLHLWHQQPVFFTSYQYGIALPVLEGKAKVFVPEQHKQNSTHILLVSGIADNRPLRDYLCQFAISMVIMSFADHHSYKPGDIRAIEHKFAALPAGSGIIVTTEKDATKLREMPGELHNISAFLYYIPIEVKFPEEGEKPFNEFILNFCEGK
jgi:tetraacyldisaccharide 4'-kinase